MNRFVSSSIRLSKMTLSRRMSGITYSGGQAFEGQGGFYASGGARADVDEGKLVKQSPADLLAFAGDVECVSSTLGELNKMEILLKDEPDDSISGKNIELRGKIKKTMTEKKFLESLSRLEINGQPIWGLSQSEREMIIFAREKVNSS